MYFIFIMLIFTLMSFNHKYFIMKLNSIWTIEDTKSFMCILQWNSKVCQLIFYLFKMKISFLAVVKAIAFWSLLTFDPPRPRAFNLCNGFILKKFSEIIYLSYILHLLAISNSFFVSIFFVLLTNYDFISNTIFLFDIVSYKIKLNI